MPRPITRHVAGPAEAEAIWRLTVAAYRPDRERLHPPSGVVKETVPDVQRAMDEGTVYAARRGADVVGVVRVQLRALATIWSGACAMAMRCCVARSRCRSKTVMLYVA